MTALNDSGEYGYWKNVKEWCLGENQKFGTCFLAMVGNHWAIVTTMNGKPEIMSDGEVEFADHEMTGFVAADPKTDVGDTVQAMLEYWMAHGWPGDSTLKPDWWRAISIDQIPDTVRDYAVAHAWWRLPKDQNGDWDFSDMAVINAAPGVGGHAMAIVGGEPGWFYVATWAFVKKVSAAWVRAYLGGAFAVSLPQWHRPAEVVA